MRNDLAALILAALVALPVWQLVRCGLAEDLVILAVATESDVTGTWAENVEFGANNDDLCFKKTILSILCRLSNRGAAIDVNFRRIRDRRWMLRFVDRSFLLPDNGETVDPRSVEDLGIYRSIFFSVQSLNGRFEIGRGS